MTQMTTWDLLERKLRKLFVTLAYRGIPRIVIASTGRAGSTMLFDAIAVNLVKQRFRISRKSRISDFLKWFSTGYIDRIENLPDEPYLISKTHDLFSGSWGSGYKFIFIYGDPLESALSVEKMVKNEGQQWFLEHQFHLRANGDYDDLFQKDVLAYQAQLENWLAQRDRNIVCIDFDDLWNNEERLSDLLGFEVELPKKRPRCEKSQISSINEELFEFLRNVKSRLKSEYEICEESGKSSPIS